MSIDRRAFLALGGAALIGSSVRAQNRAYTLEPIPAGKTLKDAEGNVVFSYLTSKPDGVPLVSNSVCCIHPFNTPGGEAATDIAPADHRAHRGIFFAWHDMSFTKNGQTVKSDFWGWGQYAPTADRVIRNRDVRLLRADAVAADLEVVNDWMLGPETILQETTTIRTTLVRGAGGVIGRVLDLRYVFRSDSDVTLHRMAYTGFCFRCRNEGVYTFFDPGGEVTPDKQPNSRPADPATDWPARPWYSHEVTLKSGKVVSSAVIDHPVNPPSWWHGARGVSFLNPCISAPAEVRMPAGKPFTLRYVAVAIDGKFPAGWLDALAAEWRAR